MEACSGSSGMSLVSRDFAKLRPKRIEPPMLTRACFFSFVALALRALVPWRLLAIYSLDELPVCGLFPDLPVAHVSCDKKWLQDRLRIDVHFDRLSNDVRQLPT